VQGGLANGKALQTVSIEARELGRPNGSHHSGACALFEFAASKGHICAPSGSSLDEVIRERLFNFTGWVDRRQARLLTTSGLLTADGLDTSVRVDLARTT